MSSEMPEGWSWRRLGDVVKIVNEGISAEAIAKLAAVAHYSLPAFDNGASPEITAGISIKSNKSLIPSNCVLFSKLNPRIPRIWRVAERSQLPSVCSTEFWPLIARDNSVDLDFLTAFLGSQEFLGDPQITPSSSTNSHQRVDRRSFENYLVPLPPLDEQRRIAVVLRSVDWTSLKAQEVSSLEARLGDKLVSGLFAGSGRSRALQATELGTLPCDWSVKDWGSLCSMVGVGIASSATHAYTSEGIPLIRNQNILFGSLDLTDLLRVTPDYDRQYASKRLKAHDVITMRTGYPGRSAVVPPELDGCQTFTTLISRPKQNVVLPSYLCGWINSERGRREVLRLQAGGAQQNLNAGSLRQLLVPLPPLSEQIEIVDTLHAFDRNRAIEQSFAAVRDVVRSDLLSGRVRVPA